jgi:LEA14-like dessication related protein
MRALLLGLVLVLAAGCGLVESPEFRGMRGWDDVAFSAAGGAQCTVLLVLYNPNPVALTATEVEVALSVRGKRVGTLSLPEGAVLPARREHAVRLAVATDPGQLGRVLGDGLMAFMTGGALPVRAEGTVTAKALGFSREVPVDVTVNLPMR